MEVGNRRGSKLHRNILDLGIPTFLFVPLYIENWKGLKTYLGIF
jgi:hypothetical protein